MSDLPNPINRYEKYLNAIATGNSDDLPTPITREEVFLDYIAKNGGGGGTDNYNSLKNLPQINGQTVKGNMSGTTLGLVNMVMGKDLSTNDYTNADKAIVDGVTSALAGKVDKVTGKGLSTNDYTNTDKAIVDGVTSALAGKADKSSVPTKTSQLTNNSGFITNSVNNLSNYYTKSNTYTKTEVDSKVGSLKIKFTQLLDEINVPTTYRSYSCNWNDYDILMIIVAQFGNWTASAFIDKAYFSTTGTGTRPIIKEVATGVSFEIYNNGTNAVMIRASSVSDKARVMIKGVTISL